VSNHFGVTFSPARKPNNRGPIEANDEIPSRANQVHLQRGGGDDAADGLAQGGEAEAGQETGESALDLDEESRGAVLAQDSEDLAGVGTDGGSLLDEVTGDGDLADDGAERGGRAGGTAEEGAQVEATEEAEDRGLNLGKDVLAVKASDAHNVVDGVALQVKDGSEVAKVAKVAQDAEVAKDAGEALNSAGEATNDVGNGAKGRQKGSKETLNLGGELDKSVLALGGSNGQNSGGQAVGAQLAGGAGDLGDLTDGLGDGTDVKGAELLGNALLKSDHHLLATVGHGENPLDGVAGGVGGVTGGVAAELLQVRRAEAASTGGSSGHHSGSRGAAEGDVGSKAGGSRSGGDAAEGAGAGRQSSDGGRQDGGDGEGLHLGFNE